MLVVMGILAILIGAGLTTFSSSTKKAQKARGADFESGNLLNRAKAMLPLLVPLFVSAFRRADELATAMECRCYHGGEGRTKLHVLRYAARDYAVLLLYLALTVGIIVLG